MSDKSHVSMEQKCCVITGKLYDTESLLLDLRFKESMERYTTTGFGISPEAQEQIDKGFIALVVIDPDKSEQPFKPDTVYRTGELAYLKREVANELFNTDVRETPFIYIDKDVFSMLQQQTNG